MPPGVWITLGAGWGCFGGVFFPARVGCCLGLPVERRFGGLRLERFHCLVLALFGVAVFAAESSVAGSADDSCVVDVVRAALCVRDDVVDFG